MISWSNNILPSEASRWSLYNSTYVEGVFTLSPTGTITCVLYPEDLAAIPTAFKVAAMQNINTLWQNPNLYASLYITYEEDYTSYSFIPLNGIGAYLVSNAASVESGKFTSIVFTVTNNSDSNLIFTQLYLQPEAADTTDVTEEIEKAASRLLRDYNTRELVVAQQEKTIAMIPLYLSQNTIDLTGHLTASYYASDNAVVTMRIYDEMHKQLYSPTRYAITAGEGLLSFPHAYLSAKEGTHNYFVTLQVSTGTLSVDVRSILYTIDGQYIAYRVADTTMIIEDFTLKTAVGSHDPSDLYTVGITDGVAYIQSAPYKSTGITGWADAFTISDVVITAAAIEFNGYWEVYQGVRYFITEQNPNVFFVTSGELYSQVGSDISTRFLVSSTVTKVAALRGWLYIDGNVDNDMGLIVAYIKSDGYAYYRQYIHTGVWSSEQTIPFTLATAPYSFIHIARLNDFRVAFTITDSLNDNYSIITDRYYQADSVEPAYITIADTALTNLILATPITVEPIEVWNESNTETYIRFNYALVDGANKQSYFTLKDANNTAETISATELYEPTILKLTHTSIAGFVTPMTVSFTNSLGEIDGPLVSEHQGTTFSVASFSMSWDAIEYSLKAYTTEHIQLLNAGLLLDFVPVAYYSRFSANENIRLTSLDAIINLIQVYYLSRFSANEHLQIASVGTTLILTHVGTNPL